MPELTVPKHFQWSHNQDHSLRYHFTDCIGHWKPERTWSSLFRSRISYSGYHLRHGLSVRRCLPFSVHWLHSQESSQVLQAAGSSLFFGIRCIEFRRDDPCLPRLCKSNWTDPGWHCELRHPIGRYCEHGRVSFQLEVFLTLLWKWSHVS